MARAYTPIGWENGTKEAEAYVTISGVDYEVTPEQWDGNTPVDATNLDHMEKGIQNSYDVKLLAVTDTEPSECATGDVYYNTTNKLLYTATGTNTWSSTGTEPLEGILYIVFDSETETGTSYSWDGSDLISVGGGGGGGADEVIISDEEPTTDDWKIWIDSGQVNNLGAEINIGTTINEGYRTNILHSKNLFDGELELGSYMADGTPTQSDPSVTQYRNVNPIEVLPNTTYTTSINGTTQQYVMHYYDKNRTWLSSFDNRTGTFTTPANCYFVNFRCYNADFTSDFANLKVQVEKGSTATTYEEYVSPAIVVDGDEIYNKNNLEVYSTSEQRIGTWIDGKPIYRKVIDCGALPNNTIKSIAHNINNLDIFTKIYIFGINPSGNYHISYSVYDNNAVANSVTAYANSTAVVFITKNDRSAYTGYAILEYTKTTD